VAANQIQITVTSKNKTGPGFAEALKEADGFAAKMGVIFDRIGQQAQTRLKNIGKVGPTGGGIFAGAAGLLAMAAPLGAAGVAMAAFGAVAIPVLTKVETAHKNLLAAQLQYNKATTASGRASALAAEQRATAGLTDAQKGLMGQIGGLQKSWNGLLNQMTPVIVTVAALAIKLGQTLMPIIQKLAPAGAKVVMDFLAPMTKLFNSPIGVQFFAAVAKFAVQAGALVGPQIIRLLGVLMVLFMQLMPAGMKILQALLPVIVTLVSDLTPVIVAVANLAAGLLTWLAANHLLIPAIAALGVALALSGGGWGIVLTGIVLVVAALMHAWRASAKFRDIVTTVFSDVGRLVLTFAQIWLKELQIVANIWLIVIGVIVDGAAKAFGWIPGVGPKLKAAAKAFDGFRHDVNTVFDAAQAKINDWKNSLARLPKEVRLKGEISDLQAKVDAAKAKLKTVPASQRSAVRGDISDLEAKIRRARAELAALDGTSATTYIRTVSSSGNVGGLGGHTGYAAGGITGAAAGGPRSRWTMVGEHGRELVSLAPGSQVRSNPDTERMLAGAGGGPQQVQVVFTIQGGDRDFRNWLKKSIRVNGGDPSVMGR